jgi:hypothetical protein
MARTLTFDSPTTDTEAMYKHQIEALQAERQKLKQEIAYLRQSLNNVAGRHMKCIAEKLLKGA